MLPSVTAQLARDRGHQRQNFVVPRVELLRSVLLAFGLLAVMVGSLAFAGWEVRVLRRELAAEEIENVKAGHFNSLKLVRSALELQGELDASEDHDLLTLRLYLEIEKELVPQARAHFALLHTSSSLSLYARNPPYVYV